MKQLTAGAALALALALTACGGEASNGAARGAQISIANEGSDRLKALNPLNQRIGLLRAIQQSGIRCPGGVLTGAYQQQYENLAMWVALCGNGKHYAVFIAPTEAVEVRDCAEHAQLELPRCRPTPPLARDPQAPPGTEPDLNTINAANANLANAP
jgi:hypothetical protein